DGLAAARRQDCTFVQEVGEVGTRKASSLLGQRLKVDVQVERFAASMYVEDRPPATNIRPIQHHLAIETARAQQRRVEHVWSVGGSHNNDVRMRIEAIHLYQHLVEGLLALVVRTAQASTALAADGVYLVHQ